MISRRNLRFFYHLFLKSKERTPDFPEEVRRISVLYYVPQNSKKLVSWRDGFTEAVRILGETFEVDWWNVAETPLEGQESIDRLNSCDFILAKTIWRSDMDMALRQIADQINSPIGLMISGSRTAPFKKELLFYDVVWYETNWYKNRVDAHPRKFHGFGIDTSLMVQDSSVEKKYDWIMVGAPRKYKRVHKLLEKEGKKLFIGDLTNKDNYTRSILEKLEAADVDIVNFVPYEELSKYYNASKACYVSTELHGGGERAVLEARSCGIKVEICEDNPKLKELLTSDIWDAGYYADQLEIGIRSIEQK